MRLRELAALVIQKFALKVQNKRKTKYLALIMKITKYRNEKATII